jgi:hypothetical protein
MPNPPKMEPQRGARGRGITNLPAEGRKGEPPEWPLDEQTPAEAGLWADLWTTPQAVAWEHHGWTRVVARYVRCALAAEELERRTRSLRPGSSRTVSA